MSGWSTSLFRTDFSFGGQISNDDTVFTILTTTGLLDINIKGEDLNLISIGIDEDIPSVFSNNWISVTNEDLEGDSLTELFISVEVFC